MKPMHLELVHVSPRLEPPPGFLMGTWSAFLSDGRALAGFVPYYLRLVPGFAVKPDGRTGWLVQLLGRTYRLRILGPKGVAFSPARSRGTGRHAAPKHFRQAFGEVDGFMVAQYMRPGYHLRVFKVNIEEVWRCFIDQLMTRSGVVSRDKLHLELDPLSELA